MGENSRADATLTHLTVSSLQLADGNACRDASGWKCQQDLVKKAYHFQAMGIMKVAFLEVDKDGFMIIMIMYRFSV